MKAFSLSASALGTLVFLGCSTVIPVGRFNYREDVGTPSGEAALFVFRTDLSSGHDTGIELFSKPVHFENICEFKFYFDTYDREKQAGDGPFYVFNYRHIWNNSEFRWPITYGGDVHSGLIRPVFDELARPVFWPSSILQRYIPNKVSGGRLPAIRRHELDDGNNGSGSHKPEISGFNMHISPDLGFSDSLGAFSLKTSNALAAFSLTFSCLPQSGWTLVKGVVGFGVLFLSYTLLKRL